MNDQVNPGRVIMPPVSIQETEKDITIEAEMTGLSKEDISLEIQGDELILCGYRKGCAVPEGYSAIYRERCPFEYSRTFILGGEVKREGITSKYDGGILKVNLPKAEKARPQKISITD